MDTLTTTYKIEINKKHRTLAEGLKKSVSLAIEIGRLLSEVKESVGHGNFLEWVKVNCLFSDKTAENYMKLNSYKIKIENVSNLSEAYRTIKQIEYVKKNEEQVEKNKEAFKKAKEKQTEYDNDKEYQELKSKAFNETDNDGIEEAKEKLGFYETLHEQAQEQDDFKERINEGNKYQDTFFEVIDHYTNDLKNDSERLEALNNIIKYCKRKAIEYQKKSITV